MLQLILTVMAIGLTALVITATLSYTPRWLMDYNKAKEPLAKGFCRLERTGLDEIAVQPGQLPMPTLNQGDDWNGTPYPYVDGGLAAYLGARYRFLPVSPEGSTWRYGRTTVAGTPTGYICLDATVNGLSEGAYRALLNLKSVIPPGQLTISGACGSTADAAEATTFPAGLSATLFITPGFQSTPACS